MSQCKICVFTATYNRRQTLPDLYRSLEAQNCSESLRWLVVDDGSTDGTEAYIKSIQAKASFPISYMKVENGGKQRAFNAGVENCEEELFFNVDSDDMLAAASIRLILDTWQIVRNNRECAGIIGLDQDIEGNIIGTEMPAGVEWITSIELYERYGFKGDTARVYRTDILREYPFVVAEGEKFVSESTVFFAIDQKYVLKTLNVPLTIVQYRPDGYTNNVRELTKSNPIGYYRHKRNSALYHTKLRNKYTETILYLVGCDLAGKHDAIKDSPYKLLSFAAWIPAKILRHTVFKD